eukprot:7378744-Prymnesium_polylepis.6
MSTNMNMITTDTDTTKDTTKDMDTSPVPADTVRRRERKRPVRFADFAEDDNGSESEAKPQPKKGGGASEKPARAKGGASSSPAAPAAPDDADEHHQEENEEHEEEDGTCDPAIDSLWELTASNISNIRLIEVHAALGDSPRRACRARRARRALRARRP